MASLNEKIIDQLTNAERKLETTSKDLVSCKRELRIAKHYSNTWKNEKMELAKSLSDAQHQVTLLLTCHFRLDMISGIPLLFAV